MEMIDIYASSFYGSPLWKLFDGPCDRLYSSWNNAIRDAFDIPRESHRYFIEEVSGHLHPMVMLSSRFLKFHQTLQKSMKSCIRYLSELSSSNQRTYYCQNLQSISVWLREYWSWRSQLQLSEERNEVQEYSWWLEMEACSSQGLARG